MSINLTTKWIGNTKQQGIIEGHNLDTIIAIPKELGGDGKGAEPKGMLVSSAAACYSMTLIAMLEGRKLEVERLEMDSKAENFDANGFKLVHYPHVILSQDATEEQIESVKRTFLAADKACAVGNMLKKADAEITIEGKITVASN
ncbi:OsmC family protein [Terribacillus aidingensis]|uniref:OsmC family protein n=1 Tax=Terribacillus aidingensis TaxID=586416 RepID=UPI00344F600B